MLLISDPEIRGLFLQAFYDSRHNADGWVPASENILSGTDAASRNVAGTTCQHLADARLIEWRPLRAGPQGYAAGMARITGHGVDVVDGKAKPSIEVLLPSQAHRHVAGLKPSAGHS